MHLGLVVFESLEINETLAKLIMSAEYSTFVFDVIFFEARRWEEELHGKPESSPEQHWNTWRESGRQRTISPFPPQPMISFHMPTGNSSICKLEASFYRLIFIEWEFAAGLNYRIWKVLLCDVDSSKIKSSPVRSTMILYHLQTEWMIWYGLRSDSIDVYFLHSLQTRRRFPCCISPLLVWNSEPATTPLKRDSRLSLSHGLFENDTQIFWVYLHTERIEY